MNTSRLELSVGCFVLAGIVILGWFAVRAAGGSIIGPATYTVSARFSNSGGLAAGSTVSVAGVAVGRVKAVRLATDYVAIAELSIRQDVPLPADTVASIKTAGLLGDKYVALAPGADAQTLSEGGVIVDTEPALDLESLISRFAFGSVSRDPHEGGAR